MSKQWYDNTQTDWQNPQDERHAYYINGEEVNKEVWIAVITQELAEVHENGGGFSIDDKTFRTYLY